MVLYLDYIFTYFPFFWHKGPTLSDGPKEFWKLKEKSNHTNDFHALKLFGIDKNKTTLCPAIRWLA